MTTASEVLELPRRPRLFGIRIAIVEDHALLAQSLRLTLSAEGGDVCAVGLVDPAAILNTCLRHQPHVVLLDLDLGNAVGDGSTLIGPLIDSGACVVVLTGSTDDARLGACIAAGAVGVISKAEDLDFLVDKVRLAAKGERLLTAQRRLDLLLEARRDRTSHERQLAPFDALTERERDVLAELMRGRQVNEISHVLYVSEATVRTHVRGILLKLEVTSQLAAVARATEARWSRGLSQKLRSSVRTLRVTEVRTCDFLA